MRKVGPDLDLPSVSASGTLNFTSEIPIEKQRRLGLLI